MYIEDIIDKLVGFSAWAIKNPPVSFTPYDSKLLFSFCEQLNRGNGLTEKQALTVERILGNYAGQISTYLTTDIRPFLETPQYKLGKRVINPSKSVKLVEREDHSWYIQVMFPYDEVLVDHIKAYRKAYVSSRMNYSPWNFDTSISWNPSERSWNFSLYEEHVDWVYNNLKNSNFEFDEKFVNFARDIKQIKENMDQYVPMVTFEGDHFNFVNVHKNIPQPTSTDVLQVLFDAKKYGISTWDDAIETALNDKSINHFTRKVLRENTGTPLPKNGESITGTDLVDTIHYMDKVLITIPGGSELHTLTEVHTYLLNSGYTSDQMSVLFRLDSSSGTMCNEYVRSHNLNNPISDDIKIFFISGKVPKPLISSGVAFDVILNLGSNSAHYTQKNLVKNHHCVISGKI